MGRFLQQTQFQHAHLIRLNAQLRPIELQSMARCTKSLQRILPVDIGEQLPHDGTALRLGRLKGGQIKAGCPATGKIASVGRSER